MQESDSGAEYLKRKRKKLQDQFTSLSRSYNTENRDPVEQIFNGLNFYVSGYPTASLEHVNFFNSQQVSAKRIKLLAAKYGARYSDILLKTTTHCICDHLPYSKAIKELETKRRRPIWFVSADWLAESIKKKIKLKEAPFVIKQLRKVGNIDSLMKESTIHRFHFQLQCHLSSDMNSGLDLDSFNQAKKYIRKQRNCYFYFSKHLTKAFERDKKFKLECCGNSFKVECSTSSFKSNLESALRVVKAKYPGVTYQEIKDSKNDLKTVNMNEIECDYVEVLENNLRNVSFLTKSSVKRLIEILFWLVSRKTKQEVNCFKVRLKIRKINEEVKEWQLESGLSQEEIVNIFSSDLLKYFAEDYVERGTEVEVEYIKLYFKSIVEVVVDEDNKKEEKVDLTFDFVDLEKEEKKQFLKKFKFLKKHKNLKEKQEVKQVSLFEKYMPLSLSQADSDCLTNLNQELLEDLSTVYEQKIFSSAKQRLALEGDTTLKEVYYEHLPFTSNYDEDDLKVFLTTLFSKTKEPSVFLSKLTNLCVNAVKEGGLLLQVKIILKVVNDQMRHWRLSENSIKQITSLVQSLVKSEYLAKLE